MTQTAGAARPGSLREETKPRNHNQHESDG